MSICDRAEALRDYAFDELPAAERGSLEQHLGSCSECAAELDKLRFATAALRVLPDVEIPQRIAFVSDKVFEPSPFARFFSSARLGFALACILAVALIVSSLRPRPAGIRTVVQTAGISNPGISKEDVANQIAAAIAQVRAEDAKLTKSALETAERKHEQEHQALMAAWRENLEVMQKRLGAITTLASLDTAQSGGGQ